MAESAPRRLTVLGATGSIGQSTLDVVARHPDRFEVFALSAHRQHERLLVQCLQFDPQYAVMGEAAAADQLARALRSAGSRTQVLCGAAALEDIVAAEQVDMVMAAIVGAAGLAPALAAARAGKKLLLANKEALVVGGAVLGAAIGPARAQGNDGAGLARFHRQLRALRRSLVGRTVGLDDSLLDADRLRRSAQPLRRLRQRRESVCAHAGAPLRSPASSRVTAAEKPTRSTARARLSPKPEPTSVARPSRTSSPLA